MESEELKQWLKDNLFAEISVDRGADYDSAYVKVRIALWLDDECICSSSDYTRID